MPSLASCSMLGVSISLLCQDTSFQPRSSASRKMMLGFLALCVTTATAARRRADSSSLVTMVVCAGPVLGHHVTLHYTALASWFSKQ